MNKKIKVLTLGDHPMSPSGVGIQTKYICEAMLATGKFQIISLGGAIKHQDYTPVQFEEYGDDWKIIPIDGYGTQEMIRSVLRTEKIDLLWFMTDPRFWGWLWMIENEIRPLVPMVYYHVWDNYPAPMFNRDFYLSNDVIVTISKVTHDIVKEVAPEVDNIYLPHAVDNSIFRIFSEEEIEKSKKVLWTETGRSPDKFTFFWNNRNARRKQSGSLVFWFKEFLDKVGHDKARLLMHTDPKDPHGQDLVHLIEHLDLTDDKVLVSQDKLPPEHMAHLYNAADCTINISDAEGFGLATLESLSCGTPIIVNMTGGLQEQVTDGSDWFGLGVFPSSKAIIGSQEVPYIYEDRINKDQFISAMVKMYNLSKEERDKMGRKGKIHVEKNYNFDTYKTKWAKLIEDIYSRYGSWENRTDYSNITFKEVA